jgi:hypothetical protein
MCLRGPFQRGARSRSLQRTAGHPFSPSPGCARCARRGERCHLRALQSTTRHSPRPRRTPYPLPRHPLPAAQACVSGRSSLLTIRLKALNVVSTSAEPENAIGQTRGIFHNASTRGVRACTASSRRLWQYSSDFTPEYLSLTIVFTLTRCALVGPATISQRTRADGATRYLVRSLCPGSTFARSFRRYSKTQCAYAHPVSFAGRRRSLCVFRRLAGLLLE